ncbi:MAG TPA: hypothetical protein VI589_03250 [Vicinamibacteria bacterium]
MVTAREGTRVALQAAAQPPGRRLVWTVTGGTFRTEGDYNMVWELPREAGLYQVELLVDHGENGFAFDALAVEVHADGGEARSRFRPT